MPELSGIISKLEKNATLLTAAAAFYMRSTEGDVTLTQLIGTIPDNITTTFRNIENIKYKLWDAPHAAQSMVKVGAVIYLASELGIIGYKKLGADILKGAVLAAIITPGSGPTSGSSGGGAGTYSY